jgi:tryptophanase
MNNREFKNNFYKEFDFLDIELYKYKVVEKINFLSIDEREEILKKANYNLFNISSKYITIDLLTDSGTNTISDLQLSNMMLYDESYAGASSYEKFLQAAKEFCNKEFIFPVHQGRAAEKILAEIFTKPGSIVISNTHFDTGFAIYKHFKANPINLPTPFYNDKNYNFKGNIDLDRLEDTLKKENENVSHVVMTITNNALGGQPVDLQNLKQAYEITKKYNKIFIIDGCRIAENAILYKKITNTNKSIKDIIHEYTNFCDIFYMSTKKDGIAHMGGFIATNDKELIPKIRQLVILYEGFPTYGGLSGKDMEVIAVGLQEVLDEDYLNYRLKQVRFLGELLKTIGVPIIEPIGGHAVFVNATEFIKHLKPEDYVGQSLVIELYRLGGIRSVEVGYLMYSKDAIMNLVRLAIPRRTYTYKHLEYVANIFSVIKENVNKLKPYRLVEADELVPHFTAKLEPVLNT